ncbi:hypothetical protein Tco_1127368 [Tanacetum coccineum]
MNTATDNRIRESQGVRECEACPFGPVGSGRDGSQKASGPIVLYHWVVGRLSLGRTEDEIARLLSETDDLDIEGLKSWEAKHRELFAMSYPYVQKVFASYDLPMSELLKVSPNVPAPLNTESNPKETVKNASQQPLHSTSKTTTDLDASI